MEGTIDKAGRLVVPKALRERLGLVPGPVVFEVDGNALRVAAPEGGELETEGDWLVIPSAGDKLTDEQVDRLRRADQR